MLPIMRSIFVACTRSRKINKLGRKSWEWLQWLEPLAYVDLMECKKLHTKMFCEGMVQMQSETNGMPGE